MQSTVRPRSRDFLGVDRSRGRGPPLRRLPSRSDYLRRPSIRLYDRQPPDRGPRMNEQIRISPIRLIGGEGEHLGRVPTMEPVAKARTAGLDLVEVPADERPPVCKILDYGKMRFANS